MSDGPFSLQEALVIWEHYDPNMPKQKRDPKTGAHLPGNPNAPWEIAYFVHQDDPQKIRELQKEQLLRALKAGSAFATGELVPAKHNAERETIPANRWPFMDLDIEKGVAHGGSLGYVNVQIYHSRNYGSKFPPGISRRGPSDPKGQEILQIFDEMAKNIDPSHKMPTKKEVAREIQKCAHNRHSKDIKGFGISNIEKKITGPYNKLKNNKT